jgi:hypothetical protein
MCLSFIARKGPVVLWSWGNYRYTIDVNGKEAFSMENTDFDDALKIFEAISNVEQQNHQLM